jgi:hypothetical protein
VPGSLLGMADAPASDRAAATLPPACASEQRAKSVMPMPGGYDG